MAIKKNKVLNDILGGPVSVSTYRIFETRFLSI